MTGARFTVERAGDDHNGVLIKCSGIGHVNKHIAAGAKAEGPAEPCVHRAINNVKSNKSSADFHIKPFEEIMASKKARK